MKSGNCWIFAVRRWIKRPRTTYLVIRISKHGIWPHMFFAKSIEGIDVEEFVPRRPRRGIVGFFHAIFYSGRVRTQSGEYDKNGIE